MIDTILAVMEIGASSTVSAAAKDIYSALRKLLANRLTPKTDADLILKNHEQNPVVWREPLRNLLLESQVESNIEVVKLAGELKELLEKENIKPSIVARYVNNTGSIQSVTQGDNARVTNVWRN